MRESQSLEIVAEDVSDFDWNLLLQSVAAGEDMINGGNNTRFCVGDCQPPEGCCQDCNGCGVC